MMRWMDNHSGFSYALLSIAPYDEAYCRQGGKGIKEVNLHKLLAETGARLPVATYKREGIKAFGEKLLQLRDYSARQFIDFGC